MREDLEAILAALAVTAAQSAGRGRMIWPIGGALGRRWGLWRRRFTATRRRWPNWQPGPVCG